MQESKPKKCTYPDCDRCGYPDDCHYYGKPKDQVHSHKATRKSRFDKYKGKIKKLVNDGWSNKEIAEYMTSIGEKASQQQIELYVLNHKLGLPKGQRKALIGERRKNASTKNLCV